jgi:pimeloyl-ACP methyl ester carboxylesterase
MNAPFSLTAARNAPVAGTVVSFDGTVIHYDLYDHPSRTLMLVVPGFWRDRRHPAMVQLAELLAGRGYGTAVVDVRGHGHSEGTYGFNLHEHHDVAAVAEELLRRLPIDSITLFGFSYGAAIAVSTAARHEFRVASLLLVSPVADSAMITPWINPFTMHRHVALAQALKPPRVDWHFFRGQRLRALDDIRDVRAPLCLIHVKNDWLIDHAHSIALYERANEPKELHIMEIDGNYHADRIFTVAADSVEPLIDEFLARYSSQ